MSIFLKSFFFALCIFSASVEANSQFQSTEWILAESTDEIKVYTKGIKDRPNAKEIKSIMRISQSPEKLLALVVDYPNAKNWRQRVKSMERVKNIDDNNWLVRSVTDLPWPLEDRTAVMTCNVERNEKTGTIIYTFKSAGKDNGLDASETIEGKYIFVPLPNGQTEITHHIVMDSPVQVPEWLMSSMIGDSFVTQMEQMKTEVSSPRYMSQD